jgi:hypothetical protein
MRLTLATVFILCLRLAFMGTVMAADERLPKERGLRLDPLTRRHALVIGNGDYRQSPLKNPPNDARSMAATLQSLGFNTRVMVNADKRDIEEAIRRFGDQLRSGGVGLFFYAGHGMQIKGVNYLIPIGTRIEKDADVPYEAVDVGRVLSEMAHAGNAMNIVILDACRDNPFKRSFRSLKSGLAGIDAPTGTFIAYATAPDATAFDGDGQNGVYTQHLLEAMVIPGLTIEAVMKRVRVGVMAATNHRQVPWDASSLTGDFYFRAPPSSSPVATSPGKSIPPATEASANLETKIYPDDGQTIWPLPPVDVPTATAQGQTVVRSASAIGKTMDEGCAKAKTKIVRAFFGGRPSDFLYRQSVYRMYCHVIKRMPGDRIRVEVSMEFYAQYQR